MIKPISSISRRTFLQGTAAAAAGAAWLGPSIVHADGSDKLRIAIIGCGGRGWGNLVSLNEHPDVAINALVDVDQSKIDEAKAKGGYESREFRDYRKMFQTHADTIDAVVISTPDHMHAPIAMLAMANDKHVYCEKPLAWSVAEARSMGNAALGKFELALQMGTQRSAKPGKRVAVNALRSGLIGPIQSAHAFTDQPAGWWAHGSNYGSGQDPVPESLDWDLWLGVAPDRAYQDKLYHPTAWRGCRSFGTGAIGDMGCHIIDTAFYGLGLTAPKSVIATVEGSGDDKHPDQTKLVYTFPANSRTAGDMTLTWTERGETPDKAACGIPAGFELKPNALVLVGEKGTLYCHMDGENALFVDGKQQPFETDPNISFYPHSHAWVDACLGFGECGAAFPFASRLTETVLLGSTVAARVPGQLLEWDAKAMKVTNHDAANAYLKRDPRDGWATEGL